MPTSSRTREVTPSLMSRYEQPVNANARAPLEGMRVLDMTWAMAGPYCTLQLALLGAQVIKVETGRALDGMRRGIYTLSGGPDTSPTFNSLNLNKLGLRLNLKHPEALSLFQRLASVSDAIVENFRPGVLDRMGLGYAALTEHNPTIIVASSSAFGATGPESKGAGYASIFNAMSGLGHLTGYVDGPPAELRDSIDLRAGTALAFAVLNALYHRRRSGEGQFIDMSSMEAIISLIGHTVVSYALSGQVPRRQGNDDMASAPHGVYPCAGEDRWVSISVHTDEQFRTLCHVIGKPAMAKDPRFADGFQRRRHRVPLDAELTRWTATRSPTKATEVLQANGVTALPVFSNKDQAENLHADARNTWINVDHPKLGSQTVQGLPWTSSRPWTQVQRPGPLLGEDNEYLLGEVLGLPEAKVHAMVDAGVFD